MELGVRAEVPQAAAPRADAGREGPQQRAMTEHILALADRAGYGAALIDAADGAVTTWPQFADTVRVAARGLSRRGLLGTDTAGVFVADAISHVVAVHAVRAAGAVAVPIPAVTEPERIAVLLKQCRARLLITSAALAELAIEAAERSWVRQVFSFGEAVGTTPFSDLLQAARHGHRADHDDRALRTGRTAADDGDEAPPAGMAAPISGLAGSPVIRLTSRDVLVAVPPRGPDGVYTSLLDLALSAGATIVAAPVEQVAAAVTAYNGTTAIVPRGTEVPVLPAKRVLIVG